MMGSPMQYTTVTGEDTSDDQRLRSALLHTLQIMKILNILLKLLNTKIQILEAFTQDHYLDYGNHISQIINSLML